MALVYTTRRHLRIGNSIVTPGTVIADPDERDIEMLVDRGWVYVTDDGGGSSGGGGSSDDVDVAATTNTVASSGAAQTLDADSARYHEITLDANCELTISNLAVGEKLTVVVTQDGTGGHAVTVSNTLLQPGGTDALASLATTTGATHVLVFMETDVGLMLFVPGESMA